MIATITGRRGSGAPANAQFNDNSANINLPVLTNSELFRADGATISTTLAGTSGSNNAGETFSGSSRSADALSIFYDATGRSYTLIAPDRTQSFFPTDYRVLGATSTETLAPGARTVTLPIAAPSVTLTYTRAGNWILREGVGANNRYRLENFVYGIATSDAATPRTGSANFRLALNATFADADFPNLINASGTGVLEANFASGAIRGLGTLGYREDYTLAGRAPATPTGNFDLTATLSSSANRFNGTINLTGIGSYSGALTGRFYGPGAEEIGASFSVSDGGSGIGAGTIVGARDATATLPTPATALLSLTGPTALANSAVIVGSSANAGTLTAVSFDPTTNRYVLGFSNSTAGGTVDASLTLDSASRDAAASSASLTAHSGDFRGNPYTATVSVPGATNPTIALTYTGFATMNYNIPMFRTRYFAHYGVATPTQTMPQTGSASYSGIITGYGLTTPQSGSGTTTEYNLSGTGTLTANFGTASINSTMNITGTVIGGTTTMNFGAFTHNGTITGNTFSGGVNRDSLAGRFYGPNADEFAALFGINRTLTAQGLPIPPGSPIPMDTLRLELDGLFVGRRTGP